MVWDNLVYKLAIDGLVMQDQSDVLNFLPKNLFSTLPESTLTSLTTHSEVERIYTQIWPPAVRKIYSQIWPEFLLKSGSPFWSR